MDTIHLLHNRIQEYPWGSKTAIAELLGLPPSGAPQAELWMGAHPKAPSEIRQNGRWIPLTEVIAADPVSVLGPRTAANFDNRLPFLFKVLAAGLPLSIQAHPDKDQALSGFQRENREGIPLGAPERNYRDPHHKPECLFALTPFWALNGFREPRDILRLVRSVCPRCLETETAFLTRQPEPHALRMFFTEILSLDRERRRSVIFELIEKIIKKADQDPAFAWVIRLHHLYPGDIGILSPLFLNLIHLNPGQAMFLSAGRLHSYLDGVGIELMANSDNVLRGGLTPKHVDVPELLRVLRFDAVPPEMIAPRQRGIWERVYETPADEFELSVIEMGRAAGRQRFGIQTSEILFCGEGEFLMRTDPQAHPLKISKGQSVIVFAAAGNYELEGSGVLYKASTPDPVRTERTVSHA